MKAEEISCPEFLHFPVLFQPMTNVAITIMSAVVSVGEVLKSHQCVIPTASESFFFQLFSFVLLEKERASYSPDVKTSLLAFIVSHQAATKK